MFKLLLFYAYFVNRHKFTFCLFPLFSLTLTLILKSLGLDSPWTLGGVSLFCTTLYMIPYLNAINGNEISEKNLRKLEGTWLKYRDAYIYVLDIISEEDFSMCALNVLYYSQRDNELHTIDQMVWKFQWSSIRPLLKRDNFTGESILAEYYLMKGRE